MTSPSLVPLSLAVALCLGQVVHGRGQGSLSEEPADATLLAPGWGPQPGTVGWSVHGLTWHTEHLDLHLRPWFAVRAVAGTPSFQSETALAAPWDNLRGAAFEGTLDGAFHVEGSLEEMQAIPSASQLFWMGDWSNAGYWTSLPGWGQAKVTSTGRVDAARARVRTRWDRQVGVNDTLSVHLNYSALAWGHGPQKLLFADHAPSFPHAGLTYRRGSTWTVAGTVARWVGTQRAPLGATTESLFRRADAAWASATCRIAEGLDLAVLTGAGHALPWLAEAEADSAFRWHAFSQFSAAWRTGHHTASASWSPSRGLTGAWTWATDLDVQFEVWAASVPARPPASESSPSFDLCHGGVPLGAALVPTWWNPTPETPWTWLGAAVKWVHGPWRAGLSGRTGRGNVLARAEVARTVLDTWPLNVQLGLETWSFAEHPSAPLLGTQVRFGVSHTFLSEL